MTAAPYCSIFLFFVWLLCRSLCSDGLVLRPSVHRLRNGMNRPLSSDVFDRSFDRRASIISIYQTLKWKNELHWDPVDPAAMTNTIASGLVALLIVLTTFLFPVPTAATETTTDTVELSKGAIVVQTTSNTLLKSTIDSKSLLKTLFVNRQELSASLERMQSTISQELASPVWKEIQKEFLAVEGDLASSIQVTGPNNVKDTVRDVVAGKLNLIVNGELVNIAIQPNLGENQDEVVISIKGFKGTNISPLSFTLDDDGPRYGPIRSYFSKYEAFWSWWATPYPSQVCFFRYDHVPFVYSYSSLSLSIQP